MRYDTKNEISLEPDGHSPAGGTAARRRTMAFLTAAAVRETLPGRSVYAGLSLDDVLYFTFTRGPKPGDDEIDRLKAAMLRWIERDAEIHSRMMDYREAADYFEKNGQSDTARLIRQRGKAAVKVNRLDDFIGLYASPLLPRAGALPLFDILPHHNGFLLRFLPGYGGKKDRNERETEEFIKKPKIFSAYEEYKKWRRITGVRSAWHINRMIDEGTIADFIRINEAFHEKNLSKIADEIHDRRKDVKLVLIAGPSSSSKTTTAKRLSIYLKVRGIDTTVISLDDYYLHPDKVPKDENGQPDFECLEALDVDCLNRQLLELFDGKEITLPVFDFKTQTREAGRTIRLGNRREALIIEGIHGLNDALTPQIASENKFKIYVSVLAQIAVDSLNRVSARDNRLLRRIVRDNQFRGASASRTLATWDSVQRGAEKHIFRFENSADAVFNSALDYELPVLKFCAEHLLRGIEPDAPEYGEARRLLDMLDNFNVLQPQAVPGFSILREFIGGGDFKY
ncbi:MAG: nucleoside kinase [Spirochaetaceae bacterium]|jgi:uridine kinase|nr:nucleoside kinase [Spirochaetaceae bacterium]